MAREGRGSLRVATLGILFGVVVWSGKPTSHQNLVAFIQKVSTKKRAMSYLQCQCVVWIGPAINKNGMDQREENLLSHSPSRLHVILRMAEEAFDDGNLQVLGLRVYEVFLPVL